MIFLKLKLIMLSKRSQTPWNGMDAVMPFILSSRNCMLICSVQIWRSEIGEGEEERHKKTRGYFGVWGWLTGDGFMGVAICQNLYNFSTGPVWMWELDYKESWVLKNWCFWSVILEKTLESPLDCKELQPVNPKGNQSWIFIERTDAKAEAPVL